MADDFDPDAFLKATPAKAEAFDPDAFLKSTSPNAAPAPTGREREHAYRASLREGSPELPAGQAAAGPDLSAESETPGQMAHEYGQIAKGAVKGIPAAVTGGLAGDVESMGRGAINSFVDPKKPLVSKDTAIPTTTEGGYLGPKGLNVMAPAANPLEAFGMGASSAAIPFAPKMIRGLRRGPLPPTDLPPEPPGGSMATARLDTGVRMLPPEVPHEAPVPSGTRNLGASGTGPLAETSPEAIQALREAFKSHSPWVADQRMGEMSGHQSLGEFSYDTQRLARGLTGKAGEAGEEVGNFHVQRLGETKDRTRALLDRTVAPKEDLAQERRVMEIEQKQASDPLYKNFKELRIPPTPELMDLIPRLQAADAFGAAKKLAGIKGQPWDMENFSNYGPFGDVKRIPTAESWDLVKQALDLQIEELLSPIGKPTKWTQAYTELKNKLVDAIDNHPNPQVAGVWKQARDAFRGPAEVMSAQRLGGKILGTSIDADELRFLTAGYSEPQMNGVLQGVRQGIETKLGRAGNQAGRVIDELLSENGVAKLQWVIRDDAKLDSLIKGLQHEREMIDASNMISGRKGSHTTPWKEDIDLVDNLLTSRTSKTAGALYNVAKDVKDMGLTRTAGKMAAGAMEKMSEAKLAKTRGELARIMTLQGPERDAVIRYLTSPEAPRASGGRSPAPKLRATGGRAVGKSCRPLLADAKRAPDGKYYIPDPKRPGKYCRIDP